MLPDYYCYGIVVKDLGVSRRRRRPHTVGTYSLGNLFVVYEIKRQVFPTAPSPTTTRTHTSQRGVDWGREHTDTFDGLHPLTRVEWAITLEEGSMRQG